MLRVLYHQYFPVTLVFSMELLLQINVYYCSLSFVLSSVCGLKPISVCRLIGKAIIPDDSCSLAWQALPRNPSGSANHGLRTILSFVQEECLAMYDQGKIKFSGSWRALFSYLVLPKSVHATLWRFLSTDFIMYG